MGEVSEMIQEGILCQVCGSYIEEGEAQDVPRSCSDCKDDKPKGKRKK